MLLCDFGSARFSSTSATNGKAATAHVGTLPYMAPEQLRGGTCDPSVDLWSFGIVLCALCVGRHPLSRVPREAWADAMARDDLPRDAKRLAAGGLRAGARVPAARALCTRRRRRRARARVVRRAGRRRAAAGAGPGALALGARAPRRRALAPLIVISKTPSTTFFTILLPPL